MMNPLEAFGKVGATGIILGIWAAALICVMGAISEARSTSDVESQAAALQQLVPAGIRIKESTLNRNDYDQIAKGLSTKYSTIDIAAGRKYLEIQANSVESYSAWLAALFDVMASRPNVRWSVRSMCAGESCNGPKFNVELEGVERIATTS